jgi:hypothetical protein
MITKKFNRTYDDTLTQAYLFQSELVADKIAFTAFSSIFADPFAANFLNLIEETGLIPTKEEYLNNQVIYSMQVEESMEKARAHYQKLLFYVGIAYTNSDTTLLAFGSNLYLKARQMPQRMLNLLQNAHKNANSATYNATLISVGFTQIEIDLLETLEQELMTVYNAQQDYIQHTYKRTEDRTIAFNQVWDEMVKISNASKLIFKDSPAKIEYYLLYPEGVGAVKNIE